MKTCARFAPAVLMAVSSILLASCSLAPAYTRPSPELPASFVAGAADAESQTLPGYAQYFQDPGLRAVLELSLQRNQDLRIALLNVELARSSWRETGGNRLPTLGLSAGETRQGAPTSQSASASLSASLDFDLFGKLRNLSARAREQFLASEEGRRATQVALVAQIAASYLDMRRAEDQYEISGRALEVATNSYSLTKALYDAGAGTELDLRAAEGDVQTARSNQFGYQRSRDIARNSLTLLSGGPLPVAMQGRAAIDSEQFAVELPAGLPSQLLERRPDILQAEHTLKADNANIGAARAALFPQLSLTGALGIVSPELASLLSDSSRSWSVSGQLAQTLFAGGTLRQRVTQAKLNFEIDVLSYQKTIYSALRDVADALASTAAYREQVDAAGLVVQAQRRRLAIATARYSQGEDTFLTLLTAQQSLYSAELNYSQARFAALNSQVSMYQALGGGWQ